MTSTEQEAVAALQQGDIQGLEALVHLHYLQAARAAYLITYDKDLTEDVVQQAFIHAYERIASFDSRRPFAPWFLRIVVNNSLKAVTREQRHISLDRILAEDAISMIERLVDTRPGPDEYAEQAETRETMRAALQLLTPIQRAVIVQRYYLGLSEAEMAQETKCLQGTIKSRLHAARSRLQRLLEILGISAAQLGIDK